MPLDTTRAERQAMRPASSLTPDGPGNMADAAAVILNRDAHTVSGHFYIDEEVLREEGIVNFDAYRVNPATREDQLIPDFFI